MKLKVGGLRVAGYGFKECFKMVRLLDYSIVRLVHSPASNRLYFIGYKIFSTLATKNLYFVVSPNLIVNFQLYILKSLNPINQSNRKQIT